MLLPSFLVHQDATGHHGSVSTKKGYENPPSRVRGRNSLSSFRVQQDTNGQQSSASTENGDEHPPPRGRGSMSLSSFRVHQVATGQQCSGSTEKETNTHLCVYAVGCRCHLSACTKMRPDRRVVPGRKKFDKHPAPCVRGRRRLSSFRVLQDATGQQSSSSTEKGDEHPPSRVRVDIVPRAPRRYQRVELCLDEKSDDDPPPSGCGRMSLSSFRVHQDATGLQSSASTEKGTNTHR
ncbi:hypothetical protein TNCV_4587491 [Trichonephila clavipes]|uniref:Uncharacterized protein n=1 Tax=Trichonephila clavipes TaxID=2585209 RepID=A0A8X6S1P1_TRICX|nr:hypothetical protein TNCV_4587491 [Trichonephila clavipes]